MNTVRVQWRRRILVVIAVMAFFVATILLPNTAIGRISAQAATNTLSLQAIYVTDSAQKAKSSFESGDGINYHIDATNSSGQALSVDVFFFATVYTSDLKQYIILDKLLTLSMAPGLTRFYTPSVIPAGVTSATYKLSGSVREHTNYANNGQADSAGFVVKRVLANPLKVPLYSQFASKENPNSYREDCGPTSVAMVVAYYVDLYYSPAVAVGKERSIIAQYDNNSGQGTNATELEYVLPFNDQIVFSEITSGTAPFSNVVDQIKTATDQGYPVIAFVDGVVLGRGQNYGGHWLVITGVSADKQTVYVNDPDSDYALSHLSVSQYESAATSSGAKSQHQPYGITVKGEQYS